MNRAKHLLTALLVGAAAGLLATPPALAASGHLSFTASSGHGHHFRNHPRGQRHFRGHHRPYRSHYRRYYRPYYYYPPYARGGFHFYGHNSGFAFGLSVPLESYSYRSYSYGPVYRVAPRVVQVVPAPAPPVQPEPACLQTREFQTRVVIDGREVDAFGTACLQPDGSWKQLGINLPPR